MQTASIKRARRGRRRDAMAKREPNGQPQRNERERRAEIMSVALSARVRHGHAASLEQAKDPKSATVLGRLHRDGLISPNEHSMGQQYAERRRAYLLAIEAPGARSLGGSGQDRDDDQIQAIRQAWLDLRGKLANCGIAALRDVEALCLEDKDPQDLRQVHIGLQHLARQSGFAVDWESDGPQTRD